MPALSDSPAQVIREMLIQDGQGTDPDLQPQQPWPVYATNEPDSPDNCITVSTTQGTTSGRTMEDGEVLNHYGFQIRVRAVNEPTGEQKAEQIRAYLAEQVYAEDVTVGTNSYLVPAVSGIGQVLFIGTDTPTSKRVLFTLNAKSAIRQRSGT